MMVPSNFTIDILANRALLCALGSEGLRKSYNCRGSAKEGILVNAKWEEDEFVNKMLNAQVH